MVDHLMRSQAEGKLGSEVPTSGLTIEPLGGRLRIRSLGTESVVDRLFASFYESGDPSLVVANILLVVSCSLRSQVVSIAG
jgi:hypothetical protein